jgi:hypothetical protein
VRRTGSRDRREPHRGMGCLVIKGGLMEPHRQAHTIYILYPIKNPGIYDDIVRGRIQTLLPTETVQFGRPGYGYSTSSSSSTIITLTLPVRPRAVVIRIPFERGVLRWRVEVDDHWYHHLAYSATTNSVRWTVNVLEGGY